MMGEVGKIGCVFGLKGLMLNFKIGIVIFEVEKVIGEIKVGKVEYCVDKVGNIYVFIGKVFFEDEKFVENFIIMYDIILKVKFVVVKGVYVKNVVVIFIMGSGVKVDVLIFNVK